MTRVHNFSAGPATMPVDVLAELAKEMPEYRSAGQSVIEMSHRSPDYEAIHRDAVDTLRRIWAIPDEFSVLLLQGGATLQFSMVPMNLLGSSSVGNTDGAGHAGYVLCGSWADKAYKDALLVGNAYEAWSGADSDFGRMPTPDEVNVKADSAYLHVTSNETINGIRMTQFDGFGARLVADMSSDMLSRPIDWSLFDLVYGGAQKNLGPSGVTIVVVRSSLLENIPTSLPAYLRYDLHAKADSLANTPPTFSVWAVGKVLHWIENNGGVEGMEQRAAERSGRIYHTIDTLSDFYVSPVDPSYRSHTNIVFRITNTELEGVFLTEANEAGLINLKGHRAVGGIRASIYNGMADESVDALAAFMRAFAERNR